ncbi:MAG TPA: DEAD/DEAH box helicase [Planctomycetaceae bacterium]|nr:DEAD/DEAH box helicase [Planctomycetaceae bacterium]
MSFATDENDTRIEAAEAASFGGDSGDSSDRQSGRLPQVAEVVNLGEPVSIGEPECRPLPLDLAADAFAAGVNGALRRWTAVETKSVGLPRGVALGPVWKPAPRMRVATFGLTFPDGLEFAPPRTPDEQPPETLERILPPRVPRPAGKATGTGRTTRLKPPEDALSIEDRLFYLLQPPLETWLRGQELIMPFEPFPYQYEGIAWLFAQRSALLADEMGLGKTMQAITAVRLLLRSGQVRRVLLVCPKPLIPNWQREFRLWAEELPILTVEGDAARRRMMWMMPGAGILIANYELLVRDLAELVEHAGPEIRAGLEGGAADSEPGGFGHGPLPKFDLLVLDEAQRIKNRDSQTAQVARSIPRRRSWALTGTPIENRPDELASLFHFLEVIPPRGTPDLRQLCRLSQTYILRRTKDLVLTDLPPRLDRDEFLELTPAQEHAYRIAESEGVVQLNGLGESITVQHVFELVLRLKQITNFDPLTGDSSKLDRLLADMEEISASGGKAILFSQWTKAIDWLKARLDERLPECGTLVYHGGVPTARREPILARFRDDPRSHLLLMSYGTGAVGLNLQFAGYVFLFDRWWNPAVEDQAINRAHRIGQKSRVIVTKFISKGTIEERIDRVLRQKRELFETILGSSEQQNVSLSLNASEIFGLFDLKARSGRGTERIGPEAAGATGRVAA